MASNNLMMWLLMAKKIHSRNEWSIRQSFDRFGDDLAELLLSYLTTEDKLKLESVSKQWQRLILKTVTMIGLNEWSNLLDDDELAKLLMKCPNVTQLDIYCNIFRLPLISQYCPHLRHIRIDLYGDDEEDFVDVSEEIEEFFGRFAKQLEIICVTNTERQEVIDSLDNNIENCINIKRFKFITDFADNQNRIYRHFASIGEQQPLVYQKLKKLRITIETNEMVDIFVKIVSLYGHQLKALSIQLKNHPNFQSVNKVMTGLSEMMAKLLIDLKIEIKDRFSNLQEFVKLLPPIGQKCQQLKRLKLYMINERQDINDNNDNLMDGNHILSTISHNFKQLKRLYLSRLYYNIDLIVSNNTMNGFKRLTHLSIISMPMSTTDQQFIGNIVANCPRLQYLDYSGDRIDSNQLQSVLRLPKLQVINLNNVDEDDIDFDEIELCGKLRDITINSNDIRYYKSYDGNCSDSDLLYNLFFQ